MLIKLVNTFYFKIRKQGIILNPLHDPFHVSLTMTGLMDITQAAMKNEHNWSSVCLVVHLG